MKKNTYLKTIVLLMIGLIFISFLLNSNKSVIMFELLLLVFFMMLTYYSIKNEVSQLLENLHDLIQNPNETHFVIEDETEFSSIRHELQRLIQIERQNSSDNEKAKGHVEKLIADISHQVKTPISNMILYSELLEDMEEKNDLYVKTITNQTKKLQWLVQSLVQLSRLENGIIQSRKAIYEVERIVVPCIGQYVFELERKNLDLIVDLSKIKGVTVFSDLKWSQEALSNVLENSIKYTKNHGKITIEVEAYDFFVCISVSDTGIGINQEEITKVFQRFYRSQAVKEIQGVGIGLSLTREIMERQCGYISIESQVNQGTKVKLFFMKNGLVSSV
jgi:signal transduction histidine kinase